MRKLAVLLLFVLAALPAHADREWYGWQVFLVDAGTIGLGVAAKSAALAEGGYLLGGPIVHLVHGDYGEAGLDLGLRVALPLGGALVGDQLSGGCKGDCDGPGGGFLVGGLAGGAAALIVDYVVLSMHETGTSASFAPTQGGGVLSIAGRF